MEVKSDNVEIPEPRDGRGEGGTGAALAVTDQLSELSRLKSRGKRKKMWKFQTVYFEPFAGTFQITQKKYASHDNVRTMPENDVTWPWLCLEPELENYIWLVRNFA